MPNDVLFRLTGRRRAAPAIDISALSLPDTKAARAALALCTELSPAFMVTHCTRTYWFSRLLGERWKIEFDDELLYVGAMLHDIALMPGFQDRKPEESCFTLPSARAARALVAPLGWDQRRQDLLGEAILLNPNPAVPVSRGAEAHLLNAGVMVDAIGLRQWAFQAKTLESILAMAPRLDMKKRIVDLVDEEADAHPGARFAFARRWFFFKRRVQKGPFEDSPVTGG
jgi:hypothetical protein